MAHHDFHPDWVSSPGDTITDILLEREMSEADFARRIGFTTEDTNDLLQGRMAISIATARRLEQVLGASVEFWVSRDFQYRQDVATLQFNGEKWLEELPLSDMIRFGWIKPVPRPTEEMAACLRFFNVTSVAAWHEKYMARPQIAAFRTSSAYDSKPAAVAAWLRQGEIEGGTIHCKPWSAEKFRDALVNIRSLTRDKHPKRFVAELQRICAECGVAVVVVRAPTGCRASGATRFLSEEKALLLLSFRFLTDDQFWFTFFHEAGHLLLHGKDGFFLESENGQSSQAEAEANEFAATTLIPVELQPTLMSLRPYTMDVVRFSVRLGISPGLVVGQLQHMKKLKPSQLNRLKRRYQWED